MPWDDKLAHSITVSDRAPLRTLRDGATYLGEIAKRIPTATLAATVEGMIAAAEQGGEDRIAAATDELEYVVAHMGHLGSARRLPDMYTRIKQAIEREARIGKS
jgi:hypothetical protein